MLKLKFKLCGKKQQPIYKLGLMLSTSSRNSNSGQNLGKRLHNFYSLVQI